LALITLLCDAVHELCNLNASEVGVLARVNHKVCPFAFHGISHLQAANQVAREAQK
jgi:hypothetical protein